jgi:hypothetical protein
MPWAGTEPQVWTLGSMSGPRVVGLSRAGSRASRSSAAMAWSGRNPVAAITSSASTARRSASARSSPCHWLPTSRTRWLVDSTALMRKPATSWMRPASTRAARSVASRPRVGSSSARRCPCRPAAAVADRTAQTISVPGAWFGPGRLVLELARRPRRDRLGSVELVGSVERSVPPSCDGRTGAHAATEGSRTP